MSCLGDDAGLDVLGEALDRAKRAGVHHEVTRSSENLAESLRRGDRVMVTGRLRQRSFETRDGDKRTVIELDAYEVGASLQFRTAKLAAAKRSTGGGDEAGDPWASTSTLGDDEPPF